MKNILCFGDSNTWGYDPVTGSRYAYDVRWTVETAADAARLPHPGVRPQGPHDRVS